MKLKAWWGALSLRARLALAFGAMAAGALVFLLAIVARTLGTTALAQGKILPAAVFALAVFFLGGWFVAAWCLREIGKLAARSAAPSAAFDEAIPIPAELEGLSALLRREAARRDRLLGELQRFTADAAHELRTPLTALRSTGEVALHRASLGRASDGDTLREAMETMLEEAAAMSALLERLLRLARLESEAVQVRRIALAEHLASWREGLLVLAEEKQIVVDLDCPSDAALLCVETDPALLGHAVTNLLHNAIQHSPTGSTIRLAVRRVVAEGGEAIAIKVGDEGPGIAPEDHARIFERFYRINYTRGRAGKAGIGHGLGLCIAKTAVERLGGQLTLRSAASQAASSEASTGRTGAEFTITLPLKMPLNLTKS